MPVLSNNHLAEGDPLGEGAVGQQGALGEGGDVVEAELLSLVLEEQFVGVGVELEVVYFGVVVDLADDGGGVEVEQGDGLQVQQVGDHLDPLLVDPGADEVGLHVFGPAGAQRLIPAVFDEGELPCVGYHAEVGAGEVEFLVACALPVYLACFVGLDVGDDEGLVGVSDCVPVEVEVDLGDFKSVVALEDAFLGASFDLDQHLRGTHVVEKIFPFPEFLDTCVVEIN